MKTLKLVAIAAMAFTLAACCSCRNGKSLVPLHGTEWSLSQLYGSPVESNNYRMTLAADGSISGVGDCNRFSGSFAQNVNKLSVADNLVSTKMMCLNQAQEDKFFGMLRDIDSYSIDGTRLMLIKGGDVLAIFDPVTAPKAE